MMLLLLVMLRLYQSGLSLSLSLALSPSLKAYSHTKLWFILYFHLFFYESPMVCVWGQKFFSILSEIWKGGCVMEFTITPMGAPVPALFYPCEWEIISIPPPSISSSSLALGPLLLQTELHSSYTSSLSLPLTQTYTHFLLYCLFCRALSLFFLSLFVKLHKSDKLWQQWKYVLCCDCVVLNPVLSACSALSTTTRMTFASACRTPPTS